MKNSKSLHIISDLDKSTKLQYMYNKFPYKSACGEERQQGFVLTAEKALFIFQVLITEWKIEFLNRKTGWSFRGVCQGSQISMIQFTIEYH